MQREALLEYITALDFMAVDLGLYLDTHPLDEKAIKKYNKIISESKKVKKKYEEEYGPLCSFRDMSCDDKYEWISSPWPWDPDYI